MANSKKIQILAKLILQVHEVRSRFMPGCLGKSGEPLFIYVYGPKFSVVGRVVSLGSNRISYEFMDFGMDHPLHVQADLFSGETGFHLRRLPCSLVAQSCCHMGGGIQTAPMRRSELKVTAVGSGMRAAFIDLVAQVHSWDLGQGASETRAIKVRNGQLCRTHVLRETFLGWLEKCLSAEDRGSLCSHATQFGNCNPSDRGRDHHQHPEGEEEQRVDPPLESGRNMHPGLDSIVEERGDSVEWWRHEVSIHQE